MRARLLAATLFPALIAAAPPAPRRSIVLTDAVRLAKGPEGVLRAWFPVPRGLKQQKVSLLGVDSPFPYRETVEKEYGNRFVYVQSSGPVRYPVELKVRYAVEREENDALDAPGGEALPAAERALFTLPRGKVVINDEVRRIAAATRKDAPLATARGVYDYVFDHMAYDKTVPGYGEGDVLRACAVGKGNCTDFHSLFMAIAMANGLPARFQMGLSLSTETAKSLGRSYHCWAEFYVDGKGWLPVDISEAWKNPARKAFLFGHLDPNRVTLSLGREVRLEPPQAGERLNYVAYPYLEIAGRPFKDYELARDYKDDAETKGGMTR